MARVAQCGRAGLRRVSSSVLAALLAYGVVAGCQSDSTLPATQIVVSITSDIDVGLRLSHVQITLSKPDAADGGNADDVSDRRDVKLTAGQQDAAEKRLPLTFAITRGSSQSVLIHVVGFGTLRTGGSDRKLVEQRALASFQVGKTVLVDMFLGQICIDKDCGNDTDLVCYPTKVGEVLGGACGPADVL